MKKIGFITTNRVLAQSLTAIVNDCSELEAEPFILLDPRQVPLDAEVLKIDVAVVDISMEAGASDESDMAWPSLCDSLRSTVPGCMILLLVPQGNVKQRYAAIKAVRNNAADDFVFSDLSLDYLFAKLMVLLNVQV